MLAHTLALPSNEGIIHFSQSSDLTIRKTLTYAGFLPTGETITAAWFTVKRSRSDADPGLFQKQISTSDVPGTGQIENDGGADEDLILRFDINPADTVLLDERPARFEIKVLTSTSDFDYPERGTCWATRNVTTDTS